VKSQKAIMFPASDVEDPPYSGLCIQGKDIRLNDITNVYEVSRVLPRSKDDRVLSAEQFLGELSDDAG
jgi:hypothetical protein